MKIRNQLWLAAIAAVLGLPAAAQAAPFTPGDLVVEQTGNGAAALSSASQALFLDEFTPSGTLVQSIPLPTATIGAQQAITDSGVSMSEGMLTLSQNGQYLTVPGYDAAPGTAGIANSSGIDRTVALVTSSGSVDTSTHAALLEGNGFRSVVSNNSGTGFYLGGAGTSPDNGIYLLPFGATSVSAATNINDVPSVKGLNIIGNTLYASTGTGTNSSIVQIGTTGTLPTSSVATLTQLSGLPTGASPHQFLIFTEGANQVAYIADDTGNALSKYELVSGTWTAEGHVGTGAQDWAGLTGTYNPLTGTATLFGTELNGEPTAGAAAKFVSVIDTSGAGGSLTGTTINTLATAGAHEMFMGVAFAPIAAPEPATGVLALLGLIGVATYGWRRRRVA